MELQKGPMMVQYFGITRQAFIKNDMKHKLIPPLCLIYLETVRDTLGNFPSFVLIMTFSEYFQFSCNFSEREGIVIVTICLETIGLEDFTSEANLMNFDI